MFTQIDWLVRLERNKDLLVEAERERLAKNAISALGARKESKKAAVHKHVQPKSLEVACCRIVNS